MGRSLLLRCTIDRCPDLQRPIVSGVKTNVERKPSVLGELDLTLSSVDVPTRSRVARPRNDRSASVRLGTCSAVERETEVVPCGVDELIVWVVEDYDGDCEGSGDECEESGEHLGLVG